MNKIKTIQQMEELLRKFYDGATTADEERALQGFVSSEECPKDWDVHRTVLTALSTPDEVSVPTASPSASRHPYVRAVP